MKLHVTKEYHGTPISEKLASNFIELGYGLQVEGMAAEMFFNRSFEPFYPYRLSNKVWFDLLEDEGNPDSRLETDWRKSEGKNLVVNVLNRSEADGELELDLSEFAVRDGEAGGVLLAGDSLLSMNRLHDTQIRERPAAAEVRDSTFRAAARRLSYAEYIVPLA